jgi:hypothetical protein
MDRVGVESTTSHIRIILVRHHRCRGGGKMDWR